MSKNNILDVLAAAALRATGGSVPKAIRLLSEPFAMAPKRDSAEQRAERVIGFYQQLIVELAGMGFGTYDKLVKRWKKALMRGSREDESADGTAVPPELSNLPELAMLYKVLQRWNGAEEALPLFVGKAPFIDGAAPPPPATKKARRSRGGKYVVIPIHDAMAAKRPRPAHRELILYILMKYGEKPYNSTSAKDIIYEVLRGLPGLTGSDGKPYAGKQKAGAKLFITWVSNFLADNLLKQYLGIQGRPIINLQDPELVRYQDAIDAKMRELGVAENDNWREATELSDEDIRFYGEHFESDEAQDDVRKALEKTQVMGENDKIYDYFNWATYPLGENDPLSLPPTRSAPDWFNFYRPERNDVPFKAAEPKKNAPKKKRVQSSSSPGTGPKVAIRGGTSSVPRETYPVRQQEPTIDQLRDEIEKSRKRLNEELSKPNLDSALVNILTSRMGVFAATIARLQQQQEEVLLRPAVPRRQQQQQRQALDTDLGGGVLRGDFGGIMGDFDFLLPSPPQLALDAQNNGDFQTSQHILFESVPGSLGDGGSFLPVPLEGDGEGEGINIPSPVEFEGDVYSWESSYFNQ
jgi:hypothetical protein